MERKNVKTVTVEYEDGTIETHDGSEMRHIARKHYRKGDTSVDQGYIHHEIVWLEE